MEQSYLITFILANGERVSVVTEETSGEEEEVCKDIFDFLTQVKGFLRINSTIVHTGAISAIEVTPN